ncbi:MAG: glutamine-hydrolyzing GMP synthase [Ignavibacteria bacterium]|nr:glutamine-hydrolyzing GMP synthase [Ignavibacteria bacterium]
MQHQQKILILDFGSQYTQLIARRIRESKVYSEIQPHNYPLSKIKADRPHGIILSGGPMSVYDNNSPTMSDEIFELGIPILGLCYGLQLIAKKFNGIVEPANDREYGKANIEIISDDVLFNGVDNNSIVWMSHGDYVNNLPKDFIVTSRTKNSPICSFGYTEKKLYGLQFHPEVAHTQFGKKIIENFLFDLCNCNQDWSPKNFIKSSINEIKDKVKDKKVICALSGGVDSSVAAVLMNRAIGNQLICIHVDTGLMRKNESSEIINMFQSNYKLHLISVDASSMFLEKLKNVSDPELKRKIIGTTFIEIFENEANKFSNVDFLVQGTLYPDVIESVSVKGESATIKTHHNVGGLPEKMKLKLIEPFRELFKDEVREIGKDLGLSDNFLKRHPFPGPGLAVRVLGDVTKERLDLLRDADDLFIKELISSGIYDNIWQAFAVLLPVQTVGVMGDSRTYENVLALRAVTSTDGMTADWFKFDYDFLENISNKIIRSVRGINRIVYDISSKPPSTIEWE